MNFRKSALHASTAMMIAAIAPAAYAAGPKEDAAAAGQAADRATPAQVASQQAVGDAQTAPVTSDDIIVTANKREERALDVAGAITAFRADDLLKSGLTNISDFAGFTPGLQFNNGLGTGAPIIRGLSEGIDTSPTVASVVNNAPIGSSSSLSIGAQDTLDLDPIDITRVEVLKGPQGTLYGANTLGGLLNYTLRAPNLTRTEVIARGELSTTRDGNTSYSGRASISTPLTTDTAGILVSGFYDHRGGFVDNDLRGLRNENHARSYGVHGGFLLKPDSRFSISLDGFYQNVNTNAGDVVAYNFATREPRNGDLKYNEYVLPAARKKIAVEIVNIDYDFGFANLSSVSSHQNIQSDNTQNLAQSALTTTLSGTLPLFGGPAFPTPKIAQLDRVIDTDKFTQEVRLTSPGDRRFTWILGGYYSNEDNNYQAQVSGRNANGTVVPTLNPALNIALFSTLKEYSGFVNGTFKITPRLDLTGGFRIGKIEQTYQQGLSGSDAAAYNILLTVAKLGAIPALSTKASTTDTVKTYLATLRYHVTDDAILFARFATGFRPGGPNLLTPGLPATFDPDRTNNYEAGFKSRFLGGRGSIDITGYYTQWRDIITVVTAGGFSGYTNGGNARLYGVESALSLRPVQGLTLNATFAYAESKITSAVPSALTSLGVGDRLPYSPKYSGSASAEYRTPVFGDWSAYGSGSVRFASSRDAVFASRKSSPTYTMPSYSLVDLHAGLENSSFTVDLFVRNLFDKRAQLAANTFYNLAEVTVARPRTIGLAATIKY